MKRIAVTGVGVVAPGGITRDTFWTRVTSGQPATRPISFFDASSFRTRIAAEIDFDPLAAGLDDQTVRRADRHIQLALAAAIEAVQDSGLDLGSLSPEHVGVSLGTALGGVMTLEEEYVAVSNRGRQWVTDPAYARPFLYRSLNAEALGDEVAWRFGAQGPVNVLCSGSTAGIDALGQASAMIAHGEADVVLAGGTEAPISPIVLASLDAIKATSARNEEPDCASRPFDADRDGMVLGEGSAVLVLEEMEGALNREAPILCEITGYAAVSSSHHMTGLTAKGEALAAAMTASLRQAGVGADAVDYVCAHGSGTRQSDRHETAAIKGALGQHAYQTPVSSIKSTIGHALGAAGALQVAACVLAVEHSLIPPTASWERRDPECDLDYVPGEPRSKLIRLALATASSFGGLQAALVVAAAGDRA